VDQNFLQALSTNQAATPWALDSFASALWIALPMVGLLMFANLALGVVSRVAPQMNIFADGISHYLGGRLTRHRADACRCWTSP